MLTGGAYGHHTPRQNSSVVYLGTISLEVKSCCYLEMLIYRELMRGVTVLTNTQAYCTLGACCRSQIAPLLLPPEC